MLNGIIRREVGGSNMIQQVSLSYRRALVQQYQMVKKKKKIIIYDKSKKKIRVIE